MHPFKRLAGQHGKTAQKILIVCAVAAVLGLANIVPLTTQAQAQPSDQGLEQASTVWGTLGVLRLMEGDVSALTPEMRSKLGLRSRIAIIKESPVYEAIRRYIDDASVRNFFVEVDQGTGIRSAVNDGQSTFSSILRSDKSSEQETQRQNSQQFRLDGILDEHKSAKTADLARAIKPFSTRMEDADFTSFSRYERGGKIIQYPALSDIAPYNRQSVPSLNGTQAGKVSANPWLRAVIQANPGLRGLIGYQYGFEFNTEPTRGCEPLLGNRVRQFMPYAKFIVFNPDQNLSSHPLRFHLTLKRADQGSYSISSPDKPSSQSIRTLEFNADSAIESGTSLILPVEFGFQFIPEKYSPDPLKWMNPVFIESVDGKAIQQIDLASSFIARMQTDERQLPLSHRLLVGSTVADVRVLTSQPLNGQKVAILDMKQFIGMGSCPFLVVYDRGNNYWVDYGTVLVDRKNKTLQGEEKRILHRDVSKIRIEEREDEVSYIDFISLAYKDLKGQEIILKAQDPQLQHTDGQYTILRKGERLEVNFSAVPTGVSGVTVRINGYYIPDSAGR
jgi:hypothetical protein